MADLMPRIRVGMATCIEKGQCLVVLNMANVTWPVWSMIKLPAVSDGFSINIEICQCMTNRFWYQIPVTEHDTNRSAADRRLKSATIVLWPVRHDNGVPETHT